MSGNLDPSCTALTGAQFRHFQDEFDSKILHARAGRKDLGDHWWTVANDANICNTWELESMISLTIDSNFRHPVKIKASLCGVLALGFPNDNTFVLSSGTRWVVQIWRRGLWCDEEILRGKWWKISFFIIPACSLWCLVNELLVVYITTARVQLQRL